MEVLVPRQVAHGLDVQVLGDLGGDLPDPLKRRNVRVLDVAEVLGLVGLHERLAHVHGVVLPPGLFGLGLLGGGFCCFGRHDDSSKGVFVYYVMLFCTLLY